METKLPLSTDVTILTLTGEFDALNARNMAPVFEQAGQVDDQDVILDMQSVTFMDSSGIGAIVFLYKRLTERDHVLFIRGLNGQPLSVAKMVGIDRVVTLVDGATPQMTGPRIAGEQN